MKRFISFILIAFFLSSCAVPGDKSFPPSSQNPDEGTSVIANDKKPGVPSRPRPALPSTESGQANLLDASDSQDNPVPGEDFDMDRVLDKINSDLGQPNIAAKDIERGWYYSRKDEKKVGTPSTWIWIDDGAKSAWTSPNSLQETREIKIDELCKKTAGIFAVSCSESESSNCERIPKSVCRCLERSKWVNGQGCIAVDDKGEFVSIQPEDIKQGSYLGLPNEKKLDTPLSWIWSENGKNSRWQNPNPLQQD